MMLSREDISHEIERGQIAISPFIKRNLKENSLNLSSSSFAWATASGDLYYKPGFQRPRLSTKPEKGFKTVKRIESGQNCIRDIDGQRFIILMPQSTTLVITNEVLAVGPRLGGSYHSKVGIAAIGIGHIGTMLGPNFAGHSLIPLHNITTNPIALFEAESCVSVVFHELKTSLESSYNATTNGHLEKFAEWGINITTADREYLDQDWKKTLAGVRNHAREQIQSGLSINISGNGNHVHNVANLGSGVINQTSN